MKRLISLALVLVLVLSMTACDLFANNAIVKLGDSYTHTDPKNLDFDTRIVLKTENFGKTLESYLNMDAYPDTMLYDEEGNPVGMYNYDPETGLAQGWTNLEDGSYTAFAAGEEVNLGKPDESAMVTIPGDVDLYIILYGNGIATLERYIYLCLTDESAEPILKETMSSVYGLKFNEAESKVLRCVSAMPDIIEEKNQAKDQGYLENGDLQSYTEYLKRIFGAREYGTVNPYKPYADHKDPEGLDFDQKVILTGSGAAAVPEENTGDISSMTDYIYGKDGRVVAQYTYYECPSKEAADRLMEPGVLSNTAQRLTDTVILCAQEGQEMDSLLSAYIGYNVLKDRSVDEYVRMLEETNFSTVYEG